LKYQNDLNVDNCNKEQYLPLRAISNSKNLNAFEYEESSWQTLKTTYKSLNLRLPCCNAPAIPKTSKLGNFFFAHKNRNECNSEPESAEHIYLKSIIAKAAVNAGWSVVTEFPGQSKDDERWIADVYCEKDKARVALEIQLSYITYEALKLRNQRYRNSGVRAAWFILNTKFNANYTTPSKEVPLFRVNKFEPGEIPLIEKFELPVNDFVDALLNKKVQWEAIPWEYEIHFLEDRCWCCKKEVKQVYGYSIDVYGEVAKTVPNTSTILLGLLDIINNEELKALGLNYIGRFDKLKGNAPDFPYCNVCIHCDAPQNNHYLMERRKLQTHETGFEIFISYRYGKGEWRLLKETDVANL
jgi:hypothetical protein